MKALRHAWTDRIGDHMPPRREPKRKPSADVPVTPPAAARAKRGPGRPPVHDEAWTKVTVVLFDRQIAFLDRLAANIRAQNGSTISRAQLIRAVLDAIAEADVDFSTSRSEADMKTALLARLGRYRWTS